MGLYLVQTDINQHMQRGCCLFTCPKLPSDLKGAGEVFAGCVLLFLSSSLLLLLLLSPNLSWLPLSPPPPSSFPFTLDLSFSDDPDLAKEKIKIHLQYYICQLLEDGYQGVINDC